MLGHTKAAMMNDNITEVVEPEIVQDEALATFNDVDKWLSTTAGEVDNLKRFYGAIAVVDAESYKECKRARAAIRKDIESIEKQRKDITRFVEDVVGQFKANAKDVLAPLTSIEAEYQQQIKAYEAELYNAKYAELEETYIEFGGVLSDGLVPFERIWEMYAAEKKWGNISTNIEKCRADLEKIVTQIGKDYTTINNLELSNTERQELKAEYFATLDFGVAIQHAKKRREQLEHVKELDALQQQQPKAAQEAPQELTEPKAQPVSTKVKRVLEIEASDDEFKELISWLKARGIHGVLRGING